MSCILIIDDNETIREVLEAVLVDAGYDCFVAADGEDGWRKYRANAIDIVITDIYMPEKDGLETILQMRKERPDLPIIAMTGSDAASYNFNPLLVADKFGANVCLQKPFQNEILIQQIESLLAK